MSSSGSDPGTLDAWTVVELFASVLIPIPSPQERVCAVCKSSVGPGYRQCYRCHEAAQVLGPLPDVLPISWSPHMEQLHTMLHNYKRGGPTERPPNTLKLAALLSVFLSSRRSCIGEYDVLTCVPSPERVAPKAIIDRIRSARDRYQQLLTARASSSGRPLDADRFRVARDVRGERVLLVDDTFASGASLFSASAALRDAGDDRRRPDRDRSAREQTMVRHGGRARMARRSGVVP